MNFSCEDIMSLSRHLLSPKHQFSNKSKLKIQGFLKQDHPMRCLFVGVSDDNLNFAVEFEAICPAFIVFHKSNSVPPLVNFTTHLTDNHQLDLDDFLTEQQIVSAIHSKSNGQSFPNGVLNQGFLSNCHSVSDFKQRLTTHVHSTHDQSTRESADKLITSLESLTLKDATTVGCSLFMEVVDCLVGLSECNIKQSQFEQISAYVVKSLMHQLEELLQQQLAHLDLANPSHSGRNCQRLHKLVDFLTELNHTASPLLIASIHSSTIPSAIHCLDSLVLRQQILQFALSQTEHLPDLQSKVSQVFSKQHSMTASGEFACQIEQLLSEKAHSDFFFNKLETKLQFADELLESPVELRVICALLGCSFKFDKLKLQLETLFRQWQSAHAQEVRILKQSRVDPSDPVAVLVSVRQSIRRGVVLRECSEHLDGLEESGSEAELKGLAKHVLRKWVSGFKGLLVKVKAVVGRRGVFGEVLTDQGMPGELTQLMAQVGVLEKVKELASSLGMLTETVLEGSWCSVIGKGLELADGLQAIRDCVLFYQGLPTKYGTEQISLAVDQVAQFESLLTAVSSANWEDTLDQLRELSTAITRRLNGLHKISNDLTELLLGALKQPADGFGYVSVAQRMIAGASQDRPPTADNKLQSFQVSLKHRLLKTVFAHAKMLFSSDSWLLFEGQKMTIQIRESNESHRAYALHPSIADIRGRMYGRVQSVIGVVFSAGEGLKQEYLEHLTRLNLGQEVQRTYGCIEGILSGLQAFVEHEVAFEHKVSELNPASEALPNLGVVSAERLVGLGRTESRRMALARDMKAEMAAIPESFEFKSLFAVNTSYFKAALLDRITPFELQHSDAFKAVCAEVLKRSQFLKDQVSALLKGDTGWAGSPVRMHEFLRGLSAEKLKVGAYTQLLGECCQSFKGWHDKANFCKAVSLFLEEWAVVDQVELCSEEQLRRVEEAIVAELTTRKQRLRHSLDGAAALVEEVHKTTAFFGLEMTGFEDRLARGSQFEAAIARLGQLEAECNELTNDFTFLKKQSEMVEFEEELKRVRTVCESEEARAVTLHVELTRSLSAMVSKPWVGFSQSDLKGVTAFLDGQRPKEGGGTNKVREAFRKSVESYKDFFIRHLQGLSGEAYCREDWHDLMRLLGMDGVAVEALTGVDLLRREPLIRAKSHLLRDFNTRVMEKQNARNALKEVRAWRDTQEFTFTRSRQSVHGPLHVVTNWEDIAEAITDKAFLLQIVSDSRLKDSFADEVVLMRTYLDDVESAVSTMRQLQKKVLYLEPIFEKSKLTEEVQAEFKGTRAQVAAGLEFLSQKKLVSGILMVPNWEAKLRSELASLEGLQKTLACFLEMKRSQFPRLYLLGDEDLVDLIAYSADEAQLRFHMRKLFPAIEGVRIDDSGQLHTVFTETVNGESEQVGLVQAVVVADEDLSVWLTHLKASCQLTLRTAVASYDYSSLRTLDMHANLMANFARPLQSLVLVQEMLFGQLLKDRSPTSTPQSLISAYTVLIERLAKPDSRTTATPTLASEKCRQLVMHSIRKVGVLRELQQSMGQEKWLMFKCLVCSPRNAQGHLQRLPVGDPEHQQHDLFEIAVEMASSEMRYSWEYQGLRPPLVYTVVTDRIFLTLAQCLRYQQSTNLTGPAGTGKTETAKFFGSFLGRNVLVFNCDESMSSQTMRRVFQGFVFEEAMACFDEFNRLNQQQLSVASQLISAVQTVLKSRGAITGTDGFPCVSPNCSVIVTMNPKAQGYRARFALPQNLKNMFRTVNVSNPSEKTVFEVLIFAEGCADFECLAQRLMAFVSRCRQSLSKQSHYDWSLRKVKSLIATFRNERRGGSARSGDNELCLIKSIETNVVSVLDQADLERYEGIVREVFGEGWERFERGRREGGRAMGDREGSGGQSVLECTESHRLPSHRQTGCGDQLSQRNRTTQGRQEQLEKTENGWESERQDLKKQQTNRQPHLSHQHDQPHQPRHHPNPHSNQPNNLPIDQLSASGDLGPWFAQQLQTFADLLDSRDALIVFGPPKCGKSLLWKSYLQTHPHCLSQIINPRCANKRHFLGSTSESSNVFIDGLLTQVMRQVLRERTPHTHHLIIFDSEIDPEWIESLNSMLDDNRLLSLPNGERIKIPHNVKFVFESRDISLASPATLSRLGIMNLMGRQSLAVACWYEEECVRLVVEGHLGKLVQRTENRGRGKAISGNRRKVLVETDMGCFGWQSGSGQGESGRGQLSSDGQAKECPQQLLMEAVNRTLESQAGGNGGHQLRSLVDNNIELLSELFAGDGLTLTDLAIWSVKLLADDSLMAQLTESEEFQLAHNTLHPTTSSALLPDSAPAVQQVFVKCFTAKRPLLLSTENPKAMDDCEALVDSVCTDLGLTVFKVSCTNRMDSESLVSLLLSNFRLVEKHNGWSLETSEDKSRVVLLLKDFDSVGADQYGVVEMHETVYHCINYGWFVDDKARVVKLSDDFGFVLCCSCPPNGLHLRLPSKLARLLLTHCPGGTGCTDVDQLSESIHALSSHSLNGVMKGKRELKEVGRVVAEVVAKLGEACALTRTHLHNLTWHFLMNGLKLIDSDSMDSVKRSLTKLLYACVFIQLGDHRQVNELLSVSQAITGVTFDSATRMCPTPSHSSLTVVSESSFKDFFNDVCDSYAEKVSIEKVHSLRFQRSLFECMLINCTVSQLNDQPCHMLLFNGDGCGRKLAVELTAIALDRDTVHFTSSSEASCLKEFLKLMLSVIQDVLLADKRVVVVVYENQLTDLRVLDEVVRFIKTRSLKGLGEEDMVALASKSAGLGSFNGPMSRFIEFKLKVGINLVMVADQTRFALADLQLKYPALWAEMRFVNVGLFLSTDALYGWTRKVFGGLGNKGVATQLVSTLHQNQLFEDVIDQRLMGHSRLMAVMRNAAVVYQNKLSELQKSRSYFEEGVAKLGEAREAVAVLAKEVGAKERAVTGKSEESERALGRVSEVLKDTQAKREQLEAAELQVADEERKVADKRAVVHAKLEAVLPTLEKAQLGVRQVSKANIDELRMLKNVPETVVHVFTALLKLMDFNDSSFIEAKRLLSKKSILEEVSGLDFKGVSVANLQFVQRFVKEHPKSFDKASVWHVSQAAGPMADFVMAVVKCRECYSEVEPLDKEKTSVEEQLRQLKVRTKAMQDDLRQVDGDLDRLRAECVVSSWGKRS
jgi:hypothetical protein